MNVEEILNVRSLKVSDLLNMGISAEKLLEAGELTKEYYSPSDSFEYFDGENYYNASGDLLRDPSEYDVYSEGYTPFGDE